MEEEKFYYYLFSYAHTTGFGSRFTGFKCKLENITSPFLREREAAIKTSGVENPIILSWQYAGYGTRSEMLGEP